MYNVGDGDPDHDPSQPRSNIPPWATPTRPSKPTYNRHSPPQIAAGRAALAAVAAAAGTFAAAAGTIKALFPTSPDRPTEGPTKVTAPHDAWLGLRIGDLADTFTAIKSPTSTKGRSRSSSPRASTTGHGTRSSPPRTSFKSLPQKRDMDPSRSADRKGTPVSGGYYRGGGSLFL